MTEVVCGRFCHGCGETKILFADTELCRHCTNDVVAMMKFSVGDDWIGRLHMRLLSEIKVMLTDSNRIDLNATALALAKELRDILAERERENKERK